MMMTFRNNSSIKPVNRDVIRAAKVGDLLSLRNLLHNEIPVKVLINALCYSVANSHFECCKFLLNSSVDINGVGLYGSTPLLTAAGNLDFEITDMLLQRGADVDACDEIGRTPLLLAILNCSGLNLLQRILDAGADSNKADCRGLTPLWSTLLKNGNPDIMRLLLKYGANVTTLYFGKSLIDIARNNGLIEFELVLAGF